MQITSLEVVAIVAIGLTTVQLQTPDPAPTGQVMRTLAPRTEGGMQTDEPMQAVPPERFVKQLRARNALASN